MASRPVSPGRRTLGTVARPAGRPRPSQCARWQRPAPGRPRARPPPRAAGCGPSWATCRPARRRSARRWRSPSSTPPSRAARSASRRGAGCRSASPRSPSPRSAGCSSAATCASTPPPAAWPAWACSPASPRGPRCRSPGRWRPTRPGSRSTARSPTCSWSRSRSRSVRASRAPRSGWRSAGSPSPRSISLYALGGKLFPGLEIPGLIDLNHTERFSRLRAPLDYWNALGMVCVLAVPVAVRAAADLGGRERARIAALLALVPLLTTLSLTYSRGGLLALVAALALVIGIGPRAPAPAGRARGGPGGNRAARGRPP